MKNIIAVLLLLCATVAYGANTAAVQTLYTMPDEREAHEATWLVWPHQYQYGKTYAKRLEPTWVAMAKALSESERVNIVVYDDELEQSVRALLEKARVDMSMVEFFTYPTDDVWVRDNGPVFVRDKKGELFIQDWGFNGWGRKTYYSHDNTLPTKLAQELQVPVVDLNDLMVNEGGAVELDGAGTLMATRSAILNDNRNPDMTQQEAESIFSRYLGVKHFIWLDGIAGLDLTDMHVDGFARFANGTTMVNLSPNDLVEWGLPEEDVDTLYQAKNANGKPYRHVELPMTARNVVTTYGKNLGYKGSYVNYYVANTVVLVPNYKDKNDKIANQIIAGLYPNRKVVGIDVRNLYANGGMIHCVTQQQPLP